MALIGIVREADEQRALAVNRSRVFLGDSCGVCETTLYISTNMRVAKYGKHPPMLHSAETQHRRTAHASTPSTPPRDTANTR